MNCEQFISGALENIFLQIETDTLSCLIVCTKSVLKKKIDKVETSFLSLLNHPKPLNDMYVVTTDQ